MSGRLREALLAAAAALAAAGCAPREAYYRPAGAPAVGRDGYVGVRARVPPDAPDAEATAVAALSPLVHRRDTPGRARIVAVFHFRNKRPEAIAFLPEAVKLLSAGGEAFAPGAVTCGGRPAGGLAEVPYWHERSFLARFELPTEAAIAARTWTLAWAYRFGGREYPQATAFAATGPELARSSASGTGAGLDIGSSSYRSSGVPLLMDIPFLGVFFRSSGGHAVRGGAEFNWAGELPASSGDWRELEAP